MGFWKKIVTDLTRTGEIPVSGKAGARAYAVGDIHGRADLLEDMLGQIEADAASRPAKRTYVVFLGDLVDRGPDSAGVVARLSGWRPEFAVPVFLAGNHEEVMLRILDGDASLVEGWLKYGGAECAESYGIDPDLLRRLAPEAGVRLLQDKVPELHVEFMSGFGDTFRFGDYLFVHAGIRPGIALEEQDRADLRWIREPFLSDAKHHGFVVVHGHTIVENVEERRNRIGLDTGAYRSGLLTAIGIEDTERWYLRSAEALR